MNSTTELMTVAEAAELLRVTRSTIYKWAERGLIPSLKVGRYRRFRRHDLLRWLESRVEGRHAA